METTEHESNGNSPDGAESGAKTSDLDALLESFKASKTAAPSDELKPVLDFVKTKMVEDQQKAMDDDLSTAMKTLKKNETLKNLDDEMIRGLMEGFGAKDPAFVKAFENRGTDPKAWEDKLGEGAKFAADLVTKNFPGKESGIRTDLEDAAAAVNGTSHDAPDSSDLPSQSDLNAMSMGDLNKLLDKAEAGA